MARFPGMAAREQGRGKRAAALLICLLGWTLSSGILSGCAMLGMDEKPKTAEENEDSWNSSSPSWETEKGLAFSQKISGNLPADLDGLMQEVTTLGKGNAPPPVTLSQLRRRARDQQTRYEEVLRSQGYYNGTVTTVLTTDKTTNGRAVKIDFQIDAGKRFHVRSFAIRYTDNPPDAATLPDDALKLGMGKNAPAQSARFLKFTQLELKYMAEHGYPQARMANRRIVVDLSQQTADATLDIEAGPRLVFGDVRIEGLTDIDADYVRSYFAFKKGDIYDRRQADATVKALRGTALFDTVSLTSLNPQNDGLLPQRLAVQQRVPRSIGAGLYWSTDNGAGAKAFWEHRNLLGAGESLRLSLDTSKIQQIASANFRKPHYLGDNQSLIGTIEFADENTDAYDEKHILVSGGIERQLSDIWTANAGLSYLKSTFSDDLGNGSADLFGLPLGLGMNTSNDLLDPTTGARLAITGTPYTGKVSRTFSHFIRAEGIGSYYLTLPAFPKFTLANRFRLGSIIGSENERLPPSLRFYSGGGGSVRGYGYQKIGPLFANDEATGGDSVVEVGTELRYRMSRSLGLVTFLEGGNVYDKLAPSLNENLMWGTGVGVRYYTPIGPVRADIGIPLNRRSGIDSAFQLYFSIGQAF